MHRPTLQPLRSTHLPTPTLTPIKPEPPSPAAPTSTSPLFTSLRRTTRSGTAAPPSRSGSNHSPSHVFPSATLAKPGGGKLNLGRYAYPEQSPPSPRKRQKRETLNVKHVNPDIKDEELVAAKVEGPSTPKSASKPSKKAVPLVALDRPHPAPVRWQEQYTLIERMRRGIVAPVDDMGCERPRMTADIDPKTLRFHILISLMLSSQTKDPVTSQAVTNLHHNLPGGLTADALAAATPEQVHECINKVGFWRRKTEYIQDAARVLLAKEGDERGDVPRTIEGLCELRGVGPKMGFLALQCAWDINAGIGVDVHVHRITNRLKWHKPPTQTPEQTRLNLQSWLPPHLHKPINPMMVGFGQVICLPIGPRCDICLLGQRKICPSRVTNVKAEGRKEVLYTFTKDDGQEKAAKLEVKYEDGIGSPGEDGLVIMPEDAVKEEELEQPDLTEEGVLDILDQVDGAADV